ncbi:hypothetical protein [Mycolicibacterium helvum]|nr:hypothetical protein [Mycolicibacterium helvum]
MSTSRVIAPFAICAVVASAAPTLGPLDSPISASAATLTSAFQLTSVDSVDWKQSPPAAVKSVSGGSFTFGLAEVLWIMNALAAFTPGSAATMHSVTTALLDELAHGTPLGEALVNVSLQLSPSVGGGPASPLEPILNQIGPMLALAPTVLGGAMTVLAAIPEAVIPVVGAVAVAVINTATAAGSGGFAAAVQAGLYGVMTAAAKGIATMVNVVEAVLHDIAAVVTGGSTSSAAAAAAAKDLRAPGGGQASANTTKTDTTAKRASTTPAKGVAGPRSRHSAPTSAAASGNRSTGSARATGKRDARPASTKANATSAR